MPNLKRWRKLVVRHLHFVGPGLVASVSYIDPGNWAVDLGAGAYFGYKLLCIVLISGLAAVVLQLMAVRLGTVTSTSLATQIRFLFERLEGKHPRYRRLIRVALWVLYGLAEIAIVGTDLAELIGSAIALNLLFPRLPLFAGVLITAADVLIVLVFFGTSNGRQGMLFFEIVIVSLVLAVFVSFMFLIHLVRPSWGQVFLGLVPSKTLFKAGALYDGIGIIGATVMPHALFLGSSLAGVDRLSMLPKPPSAEPARTSHSLPSLAVWDRLSLRQRRARRSTHRRSPSPMYMEPLASVRDGEAGPSRHTSPYCLEADTDYSKDLTAGLKTEFDIATRKYEEDVKRFDRIAWVDMHIFHSTIDTSLSLLGFALTINASILTLAGAAYYYNKWDANPGNADLQGAFTLIKQFIGNGPAIIFALALLCAGQSASITATLAGQIVSEGFIQWRTSPLLRRLITRLLGVIPAAIVAAAVGSQGLNTMLVASQVLLSIVLPFVIFPLVYLCSREDVMTVQGPEVEVPVRAPPVPQPTRPSGTGDVVSDVAVQEVGDPVPRKRKSYKSPLWVTVLGYALFGVVVLANVYVLVELGLGVS